MLTRLIALTLVSFLMQTTLVIFGQRDARISQADRVRVAVAKRGKCPKTKIEVTLQGNTTLKGCIIDAGQDHFAVVDSKTGKPTTVDYAQVLTMKAARRPAWKDWLTLGAVVAIPMAVVGVALQGTR